MDGYGLTCWWPWGKMKFMLGMTRGLWSLFFFCFMVSNVDVPLGKDVL